MAYLLRDALAGTPVVDFAAPSPQIVGKGKGKGVKAGKSGKKKRP